MNYEALLQATEKYQLFDDSLLSCFQETKQNLHLQLTRWAKSGKVIRLKRGLYTLPDSKRKISFSLRWLANTLYSPSYISLEYALSYYDLIPERVQSITSVTGLKTATFANTLGEFVYRHLDRKFFFGFEQVKDEYQKVILMATPEKALLDTIYFYAGWKPTPQFMEKNIRLQNLNSLNKKRLKEYTKQFGSKKIQQATEAILKEMRK